MFARVGWVARTVAARTQPVNRATKWTTRVGLGYRRSFAKLPTTTLEFQQPGSLLHDLAAATDATTARKLHESTRAGISKIRREPGFVEKLVAFQALHGLTNAQLVSLCLRCSVARRLGTREFDEAVKALCDEYDMSNAQLVAFMSDGAALRLGTAEFGDALRTLRDEHSMSTAQLVTLCSRGSAVERLGTAEFGAAVKTLYDEHGMSTAQLVTLCGKNSVAKRLGTAGFNDAVNALCYEYDMGTSQLVAFMSDGVAKRLGTAKFDAAAKALRDEYGMDTSQLVTFMCEGVAKRLGTPEFDRAVRVLRDEHSMSTAQLATVMNTAVAMRMGDKQFMSAMSKVIDSTGLSCGVTFFSRGAFASRIADTVDDFCALVEHCRLNGSHADKVSAMLSNSQLNSVIPQLFHQLSNVHGDALQGAMSEYTGSYSHKTMMAKGLLKV